MKTFILSIIFCCSLVTAATAESVQITTRENAVRSDCRFFAPVKLKLLLGDNLKVNGRRGDWLLVTIKGVSGCIHKSAVEKRTLTTAGRAAATAGTSSDEVSLAGKGFSPQVESRYRNSGKQLNYEAVDEISRTSVSEKKLETFVKQGGLVQP